MHVVCWLLLCVKTFNGMSRHISRTFPRDELSTWDERINKMKRETGRRRKEGDAILDQIRAQKSNSEVEPIQFEAVLNGYRNPPTKYDPVHNWSFILRPELLLHIDHTW